MHVVDRHCDAVASSVRYVVDSLFSPPVQFVDILTRLVPSVPM